MATTNLISNVQQNDSCVYCHYTKDTNELFYVGKSCNKKRPYSKGSRNPLWENVVNKHGYYVEIIKDGLTNKQACKLEINMISVYGRRDNGTGICYNSLKEAADEFGLTKQTLSKYLNGKRNNKTSLVWGLNKIIK